MARPSLSLFMPAWNEEETIERAVGRGIRALKKLTDDWELIVVDDASTDRTRDLALALAAKEPRVRVLTHELNLGLGGAVKTGLAASTRDIVVLSDMDLPFDLDELGRALHLMEDLEADVIAAYRFDRTNEGPGRAAASWVFNAVVRSLFSVQVRDINFCFKVVHRRVLESIALKSTGRFIEAELVVKAMKRGFRVMQMGVDSFPRTRGTATGASPEIVGRVVRELAGLYRETRSPGVPVRPVRWPADVRPLVRKKAVSR